MKQFPTDLCNILTHVLFSQQLGIPGRPGIMSGFSHHYTQRPEKLGTQ